MFRVGDIVKLTGISRHGKNRVREIGELWEVMPPPNPNLPWSEPGVLSLRSVDDPKFWRIIHPDDDSNFKMEKSNGT